MNYSASEDAVATTSGRATVSYRKIGTTTIEVRNEASCAGRSFDVLPPLRMVEVDQSNRGSPLCSSSGQRIRWFSVPFGCCNRIP